MSINASTETKESHASTEKVFQWWDYPLFTLLTGLSLFAIVYFFSSWFSLVATTDHPILFLLITLALMVTLLNNQGRWFLLPYMKKPRAIAPRPGWKVGVATTFVPGAEPLEMLEETVRALIALDYPHDTWVLDEGDDDQVKALCLTLGAKHFSRKNCQRYQCDSGVFQSHSKHGNYNAWLDAIGFKQYEIITIFDPDHVPDRTFLSRVLGYFDDPKIGYVQVAQAYYNQQASFIARGAAEESYEYYSTIQMANNGLGYPTIIGCHSTHRVIALKQAAGFPPHDAEDLLITLVYQTQGWRGVYIPQVLARGLAPVNWSTYLIQQRRWARSVLDIKFRRYPKLSRNLSFTARVIGILHGLNYIYSGLTPFLGLTLIGYMLITGFGPRGVSSSMISALAGLFTALQLCQCYRQRFYLDGRNEWGLHWRAALLKFAKWPYFLLALYDVMSGHQVPYALTHKVKGKGPRYLLFWPQFLVVVLVCIAWMIGVFSGRLIDPSLHIVALVIATGSLLLILTEHWQYPPPYSRTRAH